jgi:hypothetical protein
VRTSDSWKKRVYCPSASRLPPSVVAASRPGVPHKHEKEADRICSSGRRLDAGSGYGFGRGPRPRTSVATSHNTPKPTDSTEPTIPVCTVVHPARCPASITKRPSLSPPEPAALSAGSVVSASGKTVHKRKARFGSDTNPGRHVERIVGAGPRGWRPRPQVLPRTAQPPENAAPPCATAGPGSHRR